jgi:hypothetical protein
MNWHKFCFRLAWRRLRKMMKDPAELAWRLDPTRKWAISQDTVSYTVPACASMYERSMPLPLNRLGKR